MAIGRGSRQRVSRDEAQSPSQTVETEGSPTQTCQVRPRDGQRNCRVRSLRKALSGAAQSLQGQTLSQVRQEAPRRPRQGKAEARGDARSLAGAEEGRQAVEEEEGGEEDDGDDRNPERDMAMMGSWPIRLFTRFPRRFHFWKMIFGFR